MENRQEIERILDRAYAARRAENADAAAEVFHPEGRFAVNGQETHAVGREAHRSALKDLFATFRLLDFQQHCRVIDPPRAVVHWRGRFRAAGTGEEAETDVLDLIEIKDGRIASLTTFFDTALAARLQGG